MNRLIHVYLYFRRVGYSRREAFAEAWDAVVHRKWYRSR